MRTIRFTSSEGGSAEAPPSPDADPRPPGRVTCDACWEGMSPPGDHVPPAPREQNDRCKYIKLPQTLISTCFISDSLRL